MSSKFYPEGHNRRSIRLEGYDYSQEGVYFIKICTQERSCLFGEIHCEEMILTAAGKMVAERWEHLSTRFSAVTADKYVVMPNHFHGILIFHTENLKRTAATTRVAPTVGNVIGAYKSITTHEYVIGVREKGWPEFNRRLWQRNYFEHINRNDVDWKHAWEYIETNSARWREDDLYPDAQAGKFGMAHDKKI